MARFIRTVGYVLIFVLTATAYVLRPMAASAAVSAQHRSALHADESKTATSSSTESAEDSDAGDSDAEDDAEDDAEEGE